MAALFDFADSAGEIPDIELSVRLQPYMVEPTRSQNAVIHQRQTVTLPYPADHGIQQA